MTDVMKENLSKRMVELKGDLLPEMQDMVKSQWENIYKETRHESSSFYVDDSGKFKELVTSIEGKGQLIFIVKFSTSSFGVWPTGDDMVMGVYSHSDINTGLKDGVW